LLKKDLVVLNFAARGGDFLYRADLSVHAGYAVVRGIRMLKCDYSDTVKGAAEQSGGYRRLAERLDVTEADLMNWAIGYSSPTTETLLRLVSILLEYAPASRDNQLCS
jgi:transcriptional regulator with XRE-family HTH domain